VTVDMHGTLAMIVIHTHSPSFFSQLSTPISWPF